MVLRYLVLVTFLLLSQLSSGQSSYCATIDKYDSHKELRSSHTAKVIINHTVLESIEWVSGEEVDTTYFGTTIFYGATSTFNNSQGVLFRITLQGEHEECFEHKSLHECKAVLTNKDQCGSKTGNGNMFCWKH